MTRVLWIAFIALAAFGPAGAVFLADHNACLSIPGNRYENFRCVWPPLNFGGSP